MDLESAICPHLRNARTVPRSMPPDYTPPFPVFCGRFPTDISEVAMVMFGAISIQDGDTLDYDILDPINNFLAGGAPLPAHRILCSSIDPTSFRETRAWKAWWPSRRGYEEWALSSGFHAWFTSGEREGETAGWFIEAIFPSIDRFENVFSNASGSEGAAALSSHMSGPIEEHGYWGSARDRLPVAQRDSLAPEALSGCPMAKMLNPASRSMPTDLGIPTAPRVTRPSARRVVVSGLPNLCVIHSGQDWSHMQGEERDVYLKTLHQVLQTGMEFLAKDKFAESVQDDKFGCFDCRFMNHLDPTTLEPTLSKSFGLAYFDCLASLERWSREHKTHLDIFKGFFKYATETPGNLRLWHEISVVTTDQQHYEYVNCPSGTGVYPIIG